MFLNYSRVFRLLTWCLVGPVPSLVPGDMFFWGGGCFGGLHERVCPVPGSKDVVLKVFTVLGSVLFLGPRMLF